jgi:hypothetical protein
LWRVMESNHLESTQALSTQPITRVINPHDLVAVQYLCAHSGIPNVPYNSPNLTVQVICLESTQGAIKPNLM